MVLTLVLGMLASVPVLGIGLLILRLMIQILHYRKDPKLWDFWFIPYYGWCRIYIINHKDCLGWGPGFREIPGP